MKAPKNLVALGSAAVVAIYTAGYIRTRAAAELFADEPAPRRAAAPQVALAEAAGVVPPATTRAEPLQDRAEPRPASPAVGVRSRLSAEVETPAVVSTSSEAHDTTPGDVPAPRIEAIETASAAEVPAVVPVAEPAAPKEADPAPPAAPKYKDGTYLGWGSARHGSIQARVVIEAGRIASATIDNCLMHYSCSWIAPLPPQVAARQSPEIDYVSGATQSTNAFYYAVVAALAQAR